jgi:site-specific recombinase XerD
VDKRLAAQAAGKPCPGFLSSSSVAQDLLVIRSLYDYLLKATMIPLNPWDLVGKQGGKHKGLAAAPYQFTSRSFNADEWRFLIEGLDSRSGDRQARLLAFLWLGYVCGLRASEMIGLKMGSILPDGDRWKLVVIGKGEKLRVVPLPSPVRSALLQYMESIGLGYDEVVRLCQSADKEDLEQPVLRGQRGRRSSTRMPATNPLGYTTLFSDVKSYFERRAKDMLAASGDPAARKLSRASAHWLRHTCATLSLKSGLKLQAVQQLLGHESITTTQIYITDDDDALQDAMEAFTTR